MSLLIPYTHRVHSGVTVCVSTRVFVCVRPLCQVQPPGRSVNAAIHCETAAVSVIH